MAGWGANGACIHHDLLASNGGSCMLPDQTVMRQARV